VSTVSDAWTALTREARSEKGWHVRRVYPQAPCEILAGVRQPGTTPGLIIEVRLEDVPPGLVLPRSNGFSVEPVVLGGVQTGRVRFALALTDHAYEPVFAVLCEDVAEAASRAHSPRQALRDWTGRLNVWQAFMALHGAGGLSDSAVLGLMGELLILRDMLVPALGVGPAIESWTGPRGEPNDFAFPAGFLEVKSTSRQAPEIIEIANAAQLDDSRGPILLAHLRLRRDPHSPTLPQLVSSIRTVIVQQASDRLADFHDLLMSAGYVDAHADLYRTGYSLDQIDFFRVGDDFPRIRRSELRKGIRNCSYSIETKDCQAFTVAASALMVMIGGTGIG
jgi:hypothetical protein